jgi:maleate cis-trans isomerase
MNVMPGIDKSAATLLPPKVRVGLIIPSVNTYSEPQFNHFAPEGIGIHVARARVAGPWKRPLPEMKGEIEDASRLLADAHPNVIIFHCTDTSMTQGPQGEGKILDIVKGATGIDAMATSRLVLEALQLLGMKKVVLLTPYQSNKAIIDYLTAANVAVVQDVALKLEAKNFGSVAPADWARLARENDRPEADGIFLSCTNTTQIEAIADIERELGKPVVNSNQAVLWGAVKRLKDKIGAVKPMPQLGRLMGSLNKPAKRLGED